MSNGTVLNGTTNGAFQLLRLTYTVFPIIAGIDKFFNILVNWAVYLSPFFNTLSPFDANTTMLVVGVIEITAGILTFVKPHIGAFIVAIWLWLIVLNLLLLGNFYDIAFRDLGLSFGAFALGLMARARAYPAAHA